MDSSLVTSLQSTSNSNNNNIINMNHNNSINMEDIIFDDKLLDFDQDFDPLNLWQSDGFNNINCEEPMKIEDIFQTDIADFTGGPTLAELNLVDYKLDSGDLDEYLANPMSTINGSISHIDSVNKGSLISSSSSLPLSNSMKANTLDLVNYNNGASAPINGTAPLTPEEIEQLVSLAESSSNGVQDEFTSVCGNSISQSSYLGNRRTASDLTSQLQYQQHQQSSQPQQQHCSNDKRFVLESFSDIPTTSSINGLPFYKHKVPSTSPLPVTATMLIKEEPASPNMDLSNLVISHDVDSPIVEVKQEAVSDETSEENVNLYSSELSPESLNLGMRQRNNSISSGCSLSSHDEGFASQQEDTSDNDQENDDSDDESFYKDYDAKDLLGATTSEDSENKWALDMGRSRKSGQQRYFWQYNVQSKGPKGTRIVSLQDICNDPHVLMEAKDPVFSPDCHVEGVKHAGKARRGDGNDLTPNPKKLLMIGLELKKLSKVINELTPVAQVPVTSRNKSRKEKNKLASRACRLKKKAQHEANKIKLFGLQQEHKRMMTTLTDIQNFASVVIEEGKAVVDGKLTDIFETIVSAKGPRLKVAGNTTEFVNSVLDNVSAGISNGGLDQL